MTNEQNKSYRTVEIYYHRVRGSRKHLDEPMDAYFHCWCNDGSLAVIEDTDGGCGEYGKGEFRFTDRK